MSTLFRVGLDDPQYSQCFLYGHKMNRCITPFNGKCLHYCVTNSKRPSMIQACASVPLWSSWSGWSSPFPSPARPVKEGSQGAHRARRQVGAQSQWHAAGHHVPAAFNGFQEYLEGSKVPQIGLKRPIATRWSEVVLPIKNTDSYCVPSAKAKPRLLKMYRDVNRLCFIVAIVFDQY